VQPNLSAQRGGRDGMGWIREDTGKRLSPASEIRTSDEVPWHPPQWDYCVPFQPFHNLGLLLTRRGNGVTLITRSPAKGLRPALTSVISCRRLLASGDHQSKYRDRDPLPRGVRTKFLWNSLILDSGAPISFVAPLIRFFLPAAAVAQLEIKIVVRDRGAQFLKNQRFGLRLRG
jgi:hypothetical protein